MVTISIQRHENRNSEYKYNNEVVHFLYDSLLAFVSGRLEPDSAPLAPPGQGQVHHFGLPRLFLFLFVFQEVGDHIVSREGLLNDGHLRRRALKRTHAVFADQSRFLTVLIVMVLFHL